MKKKLLSKSRFPLLASHKSAAKGGAEEAGAVAFEGLIVSLRVLKETADAIPAPVGSIIKGTVGGFLQVVDTINVIYATLISEKFSNIAIPPDHHPKCRRH